MSETDKRETDRPETPEQWAQYLYCFALSSTSYDMVKAIEETANPAEAAQVLADRIDDLIALRDEFIVPEWFDCSDDLCKQGIEICNRVRVVLDKAEEAREARSQEIMAEYEKVIAKAQKTIGPKYDLVVELVGQDGNVFNLIGIVSRELKRAGIERPEIEQVLEDLTSSESYDQVLQKLTTYVHVI